MDQVMTKESFARSMRRLRAERAMKQNDVASALGVTVQTVSLWERAKTQPTPDKLWAIADFFGVSVAEVMGKVEITSREIIPTTPIEQEAPNEQRQSR